MKMADTIESFVAKLQAEGVQAGQEKAEQITAEAEARARQIVSEAEEHAKKTIAGAESHAEDIRAKAFEDLELAVRDAVLKLRDTLSRALGAILTAPVNEQLSSADFLKQLIHDVVVQYAAAERAGAGAVHINVSEEMKDQLGQWALGELKKAAEGAGGVDLQATLKQAGFEYRVSGGGTVEITRESVAETLQELVGAALREKFGKVLERQGA
jgi:vacuolar-type H+-ATPase subunit E/Vma4